MQLTDEIKHSLYELYPEIKSLGLYPVVLQKGRHL
jgi:hypothetical protein